MKKLLALVLVFVMLLATGCGAKQEPVETEAPAVNDAPTVNEETPEVDEDGLNDEPVEILFWAYSKWAGVTGTEPDGQTGDWEKAMAEKFMELHPNVTVNVELLDFSSGPEKVSIALANGQAANVLHDSEARMFSYANDGFLVPIGDYLTEEEVAEYYDGALATTSIADGKAYYLPFGTAPMLMMVNKTLFEEAGCADLLPQNEERTWTFDEYYTAIKTATENLSGVYGVPLFANTTTGEIMTFQWIWNAGGRMVNADTATMGINTDAAKTGLSFYKKLVDEGLAAPGGAGMKATDVWALFDQQIVLTAPAATVHYARAVAAQAGGTASPFEIMLVQLPTADGCVQATSGFPHGFAVFKNEDPNVEVWSIEFAKFLSNEENAGAVKAANEFSFKKSQADMYVGSDDPNMAFAVAAMEHQIANGTSVVGYTELRNMISPYFEQFYLGQLSVDEFAEQVEKMGNEFLATKN